jgi:phage internal scaffolding protein
MNIENKVEVIEWTDERGRPQRRKRVSSINTEPTMTEKHHAKDCDIRHIMRKAEKTGMITHQNQMEGTYMDLANRPDFEQSLNIINRGRDAFETVPASERARFANDPAQWIAYVQNPDNKEDMKERGYDTSHFPEPEPAPQPIDVNVVNQPTE